MSFRFRKFESKEQKERILSEYSETFKAGPRYEDQKGSDHYFRIIQSVTLDYQSAIENNVTPWSSTPTFEKSRNLLIKLRKHTYFEEVRKGVKILHEINLLTPENLEKILISFPSKNLMVSAGEVELDDQKKSSRLDDLFLIAKIIPPGLIDQRALDIFIDCCQKLNIDKTIIENFQPLFEHFEKVILATPGILQKLGLTPIQDCLREETGYAVKKARWHLTEKH